MNFEELQEKLSGFSIQNIGASHIIIKLIIWIAVFVLVIVGAFFGLIKPQQEALDKSVNQEKKLTKEFETKSFKAKYLDQYIERLAQVEEDLAALVDQLPKDAEIPGMLDDINEKAVEAGLSMEQFVLQPDRPSDYYVEIPMNITVKGGYHGFGIFVSGVAALPRIVTLHDYNIKLSKSKSGTGRELQMNIKAKTYRYKEEG